MDISDNAYFGYGGFTLSVEERAVLSASLPLLQDSQSFARVQFWGKVQGVQKDYYVAFASSVDLLKGRKFFVSMNGVDWTPLPAVTEDEKAHALAITTRFLGDLAYEAAVPSSKEEPSVLKEEKRLSAVVQAIDYDSYVIPRGALYKNAYGQVKENPSFKGLTLAESGELFFYYHARAGSTGFETRAQRDPEQVIESVDVFDAVLLDNPKGSWSLNQERGGSVSVLRNLKWPGSLTIHVPSTFRYGSVYHGNGLVNGELGFAV